MRRADPRSDLMGAAVLCLLTVGLSLTSIADAVPGYRITDLGTLGGAWSEAVDINNAGQVVGRAFPAVGDFHPFVWDAVGGMRDLGTLGGGYGCAYGVNVWGQVVGTSTLASGADHAFSWDAVGGMQDLGALSGYGRSIALDVNATGQAVGRSWNTSGDWRACLWSNGTTRDLGTLGGATSWANGINGLGQIVGTGTTAGGQRHAFLWDPTDGIRDLGTLAGGTQSQAFGINDAGQVVGQATAANGETHAFLWDAGHGMQDLGTIRGGGNDWAEDVNHSGQIVGSNTLTGSFDGRAFLWDAGTTYDLTDCVASSGWTVRLAYGINDTGSIVGAGHNANGGWHGYLMTDESASAPNATPELSTWALLACSGLLGVCVLRGRRTA